MVILTPYYQTVLNRKYNECVEEPDYNFTSYNLFCLKTRLLPRIQTLLGNDIDMLYGLKQEENKNVIYTSVVLVRYQVAAARNQVELNFNQNTEEVQLSDIQRKQIQKDVDEITTKDSDACLLMGLKESITDESGKIIPGDWLEKIVPYVEIDRKLNYFVNEHGLHLVLTSYTGSGIPYTYLEKYNQILLDIRNQIIAMYKAGYLYIYPYADRDKLISDWDLEMVDQEGFLYRPRWYDLRITNDLVRFIQLRMRGKRTIEVSIGNNLEYRHVVAERLKDKNIVFNREDVILYVRDLTETRQTLAMLFNALNGAKGKVYVYLFSDRNMIKKYVDENGLKSYVVYKTEDRIKPYTLSIIENN